MKTIAILIPCLLTGGTEVATLETAKAFKSLGYSVDVLVYFDEVDQQMRSCFLAEGISVQEMSLKRTDGPLKLLLQLVRFLRRKKYELIWVQYMTPTLIPLLVSKFYCRKLVAAVHVAAGHYSDNGLKRIRWIARWWTDSFVCVSNTTAKGIFGAHYVHDMKYSKVFVVPNCVDFHSAIQAIPRDYRVELGFPGDSVVIGYLGRLSHNKGVDVLINAFSRISIINHNAYLVIAGSGEDEEVYKNMVSDLKINDKVFFVGKIERRNVFSTIKGFDVSVIPSREEGFGISALESLACETCLVVSHVDALVEVVGDKGFYFQSQDVNSLASVLQGVLNSGFQVRKEGVSDDPFKPYGISRFQREISKIVCG